ncbi:phage portal protein [Roseibium aggregatum]|uniref:phage portal protein n=1 Tax=Roseibium aggregatum TaxID=187304 RepID=UPI003A97F46B
MFGWFKRNKMEKRAAASGFTAEVMSARESYIAGRRGVAELTSTCQGCISLWEGALSISDVDGTTLLTPSTLAMAARSLALRGEAVFAIRDNGLIPAADWDLSTRDGKPKAYRLSISEAGGGRTETALAAEVLHFRIGVDPVAPWAGVSPLKRASLTTGMLQAVESALAEIYENAPIGSMIVPMPESQEVDLEKTGRGFVGKRGRIVLRESVNVAAAGGPAPTQDWRPSDLTPDLQRAIPKETLDASRNAVCGSFGVLPALFANNAQGPLVREAQRHLASWTLQPIAVQMAEECTAKLGGPVAIDVLRPVQAYDLGGRARALATIVQALVQAKEAGLEGDKLNEALTLVNWGEGDKAA